jgi:hypothetical protein
MSNVARLAHGTTSAIGMRSAFTKLLHPRLGLGLAVLSAVLLSPTLFLGFHLDDYVHRYLFSGLPGSAELLHAYESPFGIANGDEATNHWQVEAGYAPWWIHPRLLISLYRPVSAATHQLDAWLWPDSAALQHAHSLAWAFALVLAATALYRSVMGVTTVAGVAALMYALDQAHGFAIGWIANRNALVCAVFGVLALLAHHRARGAGDRRFAVAAPVLLLLALLAGESAVAIVGYIAAYVLFLERGPLERRALGFAPYAVVAFGWHVAYHALGRGARFSGLYLDPAQEPLRFAAALLTRAPLLLLGQLGLPPAEAPLFLPQFAQLITLFAIVVAIWFAFAAWPLVRSDAQARFWAAGMLASLVPACTTHPNNRLLFFTGLGAMALVSQLWHGFLERAAWLPANAFARRFAQLLVMLIAGYHLILAPFLLPLSSASIAATKPAETAARTALAVSANRDLVLLSSPDYFFVKLMPVIAALEQRTPPRRIRALSFGAVPLRVTRPDDRTLDVAFEGGLLASPLLELYRARDLPMPVGARVELDGMTATVTALTPDQRVAAAQFRFTEPLESRHFVFLCFQDHSYRPCAPPEVGGRLDVAPAELHLGW